MTLNTTSRSTHVACALMLLAALLGLLAGLDLGLPTILTGLGAITLVESAKLSQNDLQRGVIETFVIEGAILDQIPLLDIEGNAYAYNEEGTLPGVAFRAVNASYTESTGTVNQKTESLVIMGGDADVDTFIQKTRSNLNDQRATQTRMKIKAATFAYQDAFINGDTAVDANSFDGLKKRLTGGQVVTVPGANGTVVVGGGTAAELHLFFDQVDALIAAAGGADVLYMNNLILGKFRSAARRTGGWTQSRDDFGRSIDFYNGIPLRDIGTNGAGTLILPQTETLGTSTVTSSMYAVRFGQDEADRGVTGLTNGGIDVRDLGELEAKPALRVRIEFFCGVAVFGPGAARLKGILNG